MYSDDQLLDLIREAEDEIIPLNCYAFDAHPEYPAKRTVSRRFGSWSEACKLAGVESGQVTQKSILVDIERLVNADEIENSEEFFQHPETTTAASFYEKFDSWREAVDELSLDCFVHYTNQDIINQIKDFYEEYGYISQRKFKYDSDYPSSTTAVRMFGSWNEAVEAADIEPNRPGIHPDQEYQGIADRLLGSNWHSQREKALERDDFRCRNCTSETDLHVHHDKPRVEYRESEVFDIENANYLENLVTLCQDCHYGVHSGEVTVNLAGKEKLSPRIVQ